MCQNAPSSPTAIVTGILIGGKSKRMGVDKATLPWRDATMLEAVVQVAREVSDRCVLLGRHDAIPRSLGEMTALPDLHPNAGPMAGLHALLTANPHRWCLLLSCDVPRMTRSTIDALVQHLSNEVQAVCYSDANSTEDGAHRGRLHPCCALYHADILPIVSDAIAAKRLSLGRLIRTLRHTVVPVDKSARETLSNINTPSDYTDDP
jgi:molybdenum cofactor guanylyltransferase